MHSEPELRGLGNGPGPRGSRGIRSMWCSAQITSISTRARRLKLQSAILHSSTPPIHATQSFGIGVRV
eukprot:173142-Alexandrium_andersonii.AAC.1